MKNLRQATKEDIIRIAEIENLGFPESEAATLTMFKERFRAFPECFFVLEINEEIVGHINGSINDSPELPDELYSDSSLHCPNGKYQTVFGLVVAPKHQQKGYASLLIKHLIETSKSRGQFGIVLTCKDHLVSFYQKHGFNHQGKSDSTHGGVSWNDMLLIF
ncbi:GNAT family N-acetyltransferase [Psychromonas arctica]|uniref:GNAT family N-acetyltransferase n=1 Tax=Psychromonas arctica TaxID=168275 RepID=A0ABU9HE39_9GAMM